MFETLFGPAEISAELEMPVPPPVSALPVPALAMAGFGMQAASAPLAVRNLRAS